DLFAHAELETVVPLQLALALDALAIDEGAVLRLVVDHVERAVFFDELGMLARNARVTDDEVVLRLASDLERQPLQDDAARLALLEILDLGIAERLLARRGGRQS